MTVVELTKADKEAILSSLLADNFLDEWRFVESFIRSKVNQKKWGIRKIKDGLFRHRIAPEMIERGLAGIDKSQYRDNLHHLLAMKQNTSSDTGAWIRYLAQKGYEYDEILEAIEG